MDGECQAGQTCSNNTCIGKVNFQQDTICIWYKLWFKIIFHIFACLNSCFYLEISECCNTVDITSTGFAKTFHSATLGTYIADGLSNGQLSYKNYEGAYLYLAPSNKWMVSIGIRLKTLILKTLVWKYEKKITSQLLI